MQLYKIIKIGVITFKGLQKFVLLAITYRATVKWEGIYFLIYTRLIFREDPPNAEIGPMLKIGSLSGFAGPSYNKTLLAIKNASK